MRNVCTLTFIGFVSFAGFVAYAQPSEYAGGVTESMIQPFLADGASSAISIEGPLVVDFEVPEVNQTVIEAIDTRTNRYLPKLRIDFAEFPLRSLTETVLDNERRIQTGTPIEIVAQRIQRRLRVPEFSLDIEGRTAIISGTVETEHQRRLIESMLRFEPGISAVKNEIVAAPDSNGRQ